MFSTFKDLDCQEDPTHQAANEILDHQTFRPTKVTGACCARI